MEKIALKKIKPFYKNNGQQAERAFIYTMTGKLEKASNVPFWLGGDCGNIQVKSSRATICKGTNIKAHLEKDGATAWAYVIDGFASAYIMNKTEYITFVEKFGTITRESQKNGGNEKIRLKAETKAMIEWLEGGV